jgi:hypothetical protein
MTSTAIVTGMIATYPVGGAAWDYGQYALGMERLGFDVVYLEDTGWLNYDPRLGEYKEDASYGAEFLRQTLTSLSPSLGARYHVRSMDGATYGLDATELHDALDDAVLFLNVSGGTVLRPEYQHCRNKVLIDTDPGWNHFVNWPSWRPKPDWPVSAPFTGHDHFFTYAERIGLAGCPLPDFGLAWRPTRPPVVLDRWTPEPPGSTWTTVMTWKNFDKTIEHEGVSYGTKEAEFVAVEALPTMVDAPLELAMGGARWPDDHWRALGWSVIDAASISQTADDYRSYVQRSRGEFSVAKNVYVATNCGWFSCRSVCYLAAGRPVVVQDTGFSDVLPTGDGLLAFRTVDDAVGAVESVEHDYAHHSTAARQFAAEHFAAESVLGQLVDEVGCA